ncbi:MAG: serine/threonine-protein phosphatase [Planctomycetes bacterium]|nr:serine/threonine-protein phosphatase [Planctomycetota bacterium]
MNQERNGDLEDKPQNQKEKEIKEIERLLEETGSYKTLKREELDNKPNAEQTGIEKVEDIYDIIEENDDVIIHPNHENSKQAESIDTDESEYEHPDSKIMDISKSGIMALTVADDETGLHNKKVTDNHDSSNKLYLDEQKEHDFLTDTSVKLEREELFREEGEFKDTIIHSDDSQIIDKNLLHPEVLNIESLIEDSLEQFLTDNINADIEEESAFELKNLDDEMDSSEEIGVEELDFEPVESKTKFIKSAKLENHAGYANKHSLENNADDTEKDLFVSAPYYIQEKSTVIKDAKTIISDIEQFKKDMGIQDSLQASARQLEDESSVSAELNIEFTQESPDFDESFDDPFSFVSDAEQSGEFEQQEDNFSENSYNVGAVEMSENDIDHLENDTDTFNKLGSSVIKSFDPEVDKIFEDNIGLIDNSEDKLILKDHIKSEPEKLMTDADSKIIVDQTAKIGRGRLDRNNLVENKVTQTTETFLVEEARKAGSEVFEKIVQAADYGILRFDEDEEFKLTEKEIEKEMKNRFGTVDGSKAERMIVQYALMKQKFKKLQNAHKRVLAAMKKAKLYQQQMMPKAPKDLPNLEFGTLYKPAEQVSGDFYDFIELNQNRWAVAVGDSAGHGIAPALIMTVTKKLLSVFIREGSSILEAMRKTNYYITQNIPAATFITAVAGEIDLTKASFTFVRAGHPAIILYNPKERGEEPIMHSPNGMALGMDPGRLFNATLEEKRIELIPGDLIVMFSDGVFEISDMNHKRFGMKRFINLIKDFGNGSVSFLIRKINNSLQEFRAGSIQDDDLSVICLRYLSHESPETRHKKT